MANNQAPNNLHSTVGIDDNKEDNKLVNCDEFEKSFQLENDLQKSSSNFLEK